MIIRLVTLLAASAAQADWQFTRWGMSPQELVELGGGKIVSPSFLGAAV